MSVNIENLDVTYVDDVKCFAVRPGDVVHVKLGVSGPDMADSFPWIPGKSECDAVRDDFEAMLPEGVKVIVTHFGVEVDSVLQDDRQDTNG